MTQRYFVEHPIAGQEATLEAAEAHHLTHVMRAKAGAQVILFDGRGGEYAAEVTQLQRSQVKLAVLAHDPIERELAVPVTVGVPLPKGDRQKWLIEKLVELGVHRFVPLETTRGVAQAGDGALDRLRRAVIEASKQCGRNRLMEIHTPQNWNEFVAGVDGAAQLWIAHPGSSRSLAEFLRTSTAAPVAGFVTAVGPEGGLTDDEVAQAIAAGWTPVDLGPCILRVETAATLLASAAALFAAIKH